MGGASGKESAYQCRRLKRCGFDPWVRKIPWRRRRAWLPLHYSCLENPVDRGLWRVIIMRHVIIIIISVESQIWLEWLSMQPTVLIISIMWYNISIVLIYLITGGLYLWSPSSNSFSSHTLPLITTNLIAFFMFIFEV